MKKTAKKKTAIKKSARKSVRTRLMVCGNCMKRVRTFRSPKELNEGGLACPRCECTDWSDSESHSDAVAKLTDEQENRLISLANELFSYLAGDLFSALAEEGQSSMPRAEVIEVVLDAGRLEDDARRKAPELVDFLSAAMTPPYDINPSNKELNRIMRKAFPYARYSL